MSRKQVWPLGVSYRGPMSLRRGKKLVLPADLVQFLTKAMKQHGCKEVSITIHAIESAPESIWGFMKNLEGLQAPSEDTRD